MQKQTSIRLFFALKSYTISSSSIKAPISIEKINVLEEEKERKEEKDGRIGGGRITKRRREKRNRRRRKNEKEEGKEK